MYTERELRTIKRNFGHPPLRSMEVLLKRAAEGKESMETRNSIEEIYKDCQICKQNDQNTWRLKLTVGSEKYRFNHFVKMETMLIQGRPILHMVDMDKNFCATTYLRNKSSREIWK